MEFIELLDDIKEKITDLEYKNLIENVPKKKYLLIKYVYNFDIIYDAYYDTKVLKKVLMRSEYKILNDLFICECGKCVKCKIKYLKRMKIDDIEDLELKEEELDVKELIVYYDKNLNQEITLDIMDMVEYEVIVF